MSRITIYNAEQIATKLTEKNEKSIKDVRDKMKELIIDYCVKSTPESIKLAFKSNPKYFDNVTANIHYGHSWFGCFDTTCPNEDYNVSINDDVIGNKLIKLKNKQDKLKSEKSKLWNEIKNALLSLRTYKKISEQLPEAAPFLETKENTSVMLNLSELRNKLK